jgi:hypothetical protein
MSRRTFTAAMLAVTAAVAAPAVAHAAPNAPARATVGTFFNQHTEVFPVEAPPCVSGDFTGGTETITFTDSGRFVETNSGFHVEGTTTIDSHVDFTNGSYINAIGHAHFAFNTGFTSDETVFTSGGPEVHTIYNAEDEALAKVKFIGVGHLTYRDLNGNGQPDEGEITSSHEHLNVLCLPG